MSADWVLGAAGTVIVLLLGTTAWFAQHLYLGTKRELSEERKRREEAIDAVKTQLTDFRLEVAEKYVRSPQLESLEARIMAVLEEIKSGQSELFKRLDHKADKPGAPA